MTETTETTGGSFERLAALVRRDLGAIDVRLVDTDDGAGILPHELGCALPDGRRVVATFADRPEASDAVLRRFEMLVESFAHLLEKRRHEHPSPSVSLAEELRSLAFRAGASDSLVIDARSPIVWAASVDRMSLRPRYEADVIDLPDRESVSSPANLSTPAIPRPPGVPCDVAELGVAHEPPGPPAAGDEASTHAITEVRALPAIGTLARGGHLHHSVQRDDFAWLARSFASIYVLVVVFEGRFDELRAERAIAASLPVVERLVLSLPPLDPSPFSGSRAARKGR